MSPAATDLMMKGVAFLRAINVGGRVVEMDRLRALWEAAGFTGVETSIGGGNFIFALAPARKPTPVERATYTRLRRALSYGFAPSARTAAEGRAVAENEPFAPALLAVGE